MKADIDLRAEDEGRPDLRNLIIFRAVDAGTVMEHKGISVTALRTKHPPLVDCFSCSFKTANRHVVFSGDTAPVKSLADFARGADILVHEAMLKSALPALMVRIGNGSDKLMAHWLR